MREWIANGIGVGLGLALMVVGLGFVLSVPWFLVTAGKVALNREWLPLSYALRSLQRRRLATLTTFVGLSLVVFVLTVMLMLARGIEHTLESTGNPRNAKLVRLNSPTEMNSYLSVEEVKRIAAAPELARNAQGVPLIAGEMVVLLWLPYPGATTPDEGANVTVRGIHPLALDMHPFRGLAGRMFAPGSSEIVIGRSLAGRFEGAALGKSMTFGEREWQIVGVVDHGGTAHDSEIWGDVDVLGPSLKTGYAVASLTLQDPSGLKGLNAALAGNPELSELSAVMESTFWKSLSNNYVEFVSLLGSAVGFIFAFAAVLGAMNTMYAQVAARTREIGALRAIGFKRRAILTSLVIESVLLSLAAGVAGVLGASALSNLQFQLTTAETLSEVTYGLHLSLGSALACLACAAAMGYAGGLLPALRASTIPIVTAVRAD